MFDNKDSWSLRVVPWEQYRDTLVSEGRTDGELWSHLTTQTDLIVGGLNFTSDFLYVLTFSIHTD